MLQKPTEEPAIVLTKKLNLSTDLFYKVLLGVLFEIAAKKVVFVAKKEVMQDEYKLIQLENRINKVCTDFNLLKESVSWLPTIVLVCFLSGLIIGILISFL